MGLRREPFRGLLSSLQISNEGWISEPERGEQSSAFIWGLFCNLEIEIATCKQQHLSCDKWKQESCGSENITTDHMTSHHTTWRHTAWRDVTPHDMTSRDMTSHHCTLLTRQCSQVRRAPSIHTHHPLLQRQTAFFWRSCPTVLLSLW